MTNYQSTSYNVAEAIDTADGTGKVPAYVGFSTVAGKTDKLNEDLVLRVDGRAHLTLDDVRGLQSYLNDQFGRGNGERTATGRTPSVPPIQNIPQSPADQIAKAQEAGWGTGADGAATWNPIEARRAAAVLPGTDVQAEQFLQAMESAGDAIRQMQQPGADLDYYPDTDPAAQPWNPQVGEAVNVYPARMEPQGQDGYVIVPTSSPDEQNVTVAQMQPKTAAEWAEQNPHEVAGMKQQYAETYGIPAETVTAQPIPAPRQCPVIYSGVQCTAAEGHDLGHQIPGYTENPAAAMWDPNDSSDYFPGRSPEYVPQTGDGAVSPPADQTVQPVTHHRGSGEAAESAPVAPTTEVPSPSAEPAKKKSNRRKKEEKAYDDALAAFRAQPTSQLEYVALTNAAEALRKRFPDAARLENWDAHIQQQNVQVLLGDNPAPHQETASAPVQPEPHFAPEPSAPTQPTPFVPPAPAEPSAEELQAGQAFPCQHVSSQTGRPCTRPAGHELANPPKPHFYPPLEDGQTVPVPSFTQEPLSTGVPGFTVTPVNEGNGFTQATIPPFQIPQPAPAVPPLQGTPAPALSFQVPPTPEGADLQPPAPAAPPWGTP